MKLIETIDNINNGIFDYIANEGYFDFINVNNAYSLDVEYYYGRSGNKLISPLYENIINKTMSEETATSLVCSLLKDKYGDKWTRLYNAIVQSTYSPNSNYDMLEEETPNITKESTTKQNSKIETQDTNNQNNNTYGFNTINAIPTNEISNISNNIVNGKAEDNYINLNEKETGKVERVKKGIIGVTNQKLLKEEIDLRRWNFFEEIYKDIDDMLVLKVYE